MSLQVDTTVSVSFRADIESFLTSDGGAGTRTFDIWATYSAIRTMTWLGLSLAPENCAATARLLLSRRNANNAFAWQRGLPSDVWTTFYCAEALCDLGVTLDRPEALTNWLQLTQSADGGFGMMPGQACDVWATYYATGLFRSILRQEVPRAAAVQDWLSVLQNDDGGLGWSPGYAVSDTRAAFYGILAFTTLNRPKLPWSAKRLYDWLRSVQSVDGGFAFSPQGVPCLWATYRAIRALQNIGFELPSRDRCVDWILRRSSPKGFVRWPGYDVSDVWANFSAVGALRNAKVDIHPEIRNTVSSSIANASSSDGGFSYRASEQAGDALSSAATLIVGVLWKVLSEEQQRSLCGWLARAHMPWEGGIMYMPGRGAEIRCTLWSIVACAMAGKPLADTARIVTWLKELQNPDGGFGYWLGRGSDLTSTAACLGIVRQLGLELREVFDSRKIARFVTNCVDNKFAANVPRGEPSTSATAHACRILQAVGRLEEARTLQKSFAPLKLMGGYRNVARGLPDLHTTYQCHLACHQLDNGKEFWSNRADTLRFLRRLKSSNNQISWMPVGKDGRQDVLVLALYALLYRKTQQASAPFPDLVL